MAATISNLRDRIGQALALVEAANMAAATLPPAERAAMQALLAIALAKLAGAREIAARLERKLGGAR